MSGAQGTGREEVARNAKAWELVTRFGVDATKFVNSPAGRALQLTVGVANAVPKLIVSRLLQPALRERRDVKIVCVEGNPEELLTRLATHALDVVISDTPAPPHVRGRVFDHSLGESGTSFFAPTGLERRGRFP